MPRFTVVIPTYNHAEFLRIALQSVFDQHCADWNCIVVDNHSTDHTRAVLAGFDDPRLKAIEIHNGGVIAASRNAGIRAADGDWIAFLDSDDLWYPTRLATISTSILDDPAVDLVSTDEQVVDQKAAGQRTALRYGPDTADLYRALLTEGNRLSTSATVVRRAFLNTHGLEFSVEPAFVTVEDYDLWLRMAQAGARMRFLRSIEGQYTLHGANSSANIERHHRHLGNLLRHHVFEIQTFQPDRQRLWRQVRQRVEMMQARALVASGQRLLGFGLLGRSLMASPFGAATQWQARRRRLAQLAAEASAGRSDASS